MIWLVLEDSTDRLEGPAVVNVLVHDLRFTAVSTLGMTLFLRLAFAWKI